MEKRKCKICEKEFEVIRVNNARLYCDICSTAVSKAKNSLREQNRKKVWESLKEIERIEALTLATQYLLDKEDKNEKT